MTPNFHRTTTDKGDTSVTHHAKRSATGSTVREAKGLSRTVRGALLCVLALAAFAGIGASAAMAAAPTVTLDPVTVHSIVTAHATGEVSVDSAANGGFETFWCFESTPEGQEAWSQGTCGGPVAPEASEPIEGDFSNLTAGAHYEARISYLNFNDFLTEYSAIQTFTTDPATAPTLALDPAGSVTVSTAHLSGTIDPEGGNEDTAAGLLPISWQLQYAPAGEPGNWQSAAPSSENPLTGSNAEASTPVAVEADASGLLPGTEYKVRLLAHYAGLTAETEAADWVSFTTEPTAPTVGHTFVGDVTQTTATLHSEVNPGGAEVSCHFVYGTTTAYGSEAPCSPAHPIADEVQRFEVNGGANFDNRFILRFGGYSTPELLLTANPAEVEAALDALPSIGGVGGDVSVGGEEIGSTGPKFDIRFGGALAATDVPPLGWENGTPPLVNGAFVTTRVQGGLNGSAAVTAAIGSLQPGTTYHYKLLASNSAGGAEGSDRIFRTLASPAFEADACPNAALRSEQHSTFLPDCRAYEMVSPPDKHGGDVLRYSSRTQAAAGGDAAVFSSLVNFGDSQGNSLAAEYMALRDGSTDTGWATHAITPKMPPTPFGAAAQGNDPHYEGFSPELSRGVFRAYLPLSDENPDVADIQNLYVRDDLRTPGPGAYRLATNATEYVDPLPGIPPAFKPLYAKIIKSPKPRLAGASADFSTIAFEDPLKLTPDLPGPGSFSENAPPNLYESRDGTLALTGRVPPTGQTECDDATAAPTCEAAPSSQAGRSSLGAHFTPGTVSPDGSRVFFQAPAGDEGGIYMRVDATRTVQLNVPEFGSEAPGIGKLWMASQDGTRVFFSTDQDLVEADQDGGSDLYMYDLDAAPGHRLTLLTVDAVDGTPDNVTKVLGASADGHYVYFAVFGELVAGQPVNTERGLYLWHDGVVRWLGNYSNVGDDLNRSGLDAAWSFLALSPYDRVTPDGRHLLFMIKWNEGFVGHGGFQGYDHGSACTFSVSSGEQCRELYVYDAETDRLRCASCNPSGAPAEFDALANILAGSVSNTGPTMHLSHALSDDGRYVFWSTEEALVPEDTNGKFDAYSYDTETEEVHLISSGTSPEDSYFLDASADGKDVFFATRQRLLGWDTDTSIDLYDARVQGGFPEPAPVPAACEGEACRPAPAAAPGAPGAASAALRGPGNPRPHHRCPKGRRAVKHGGKTRCVKRGRHHRHAKHDRRAGR